MKKSIKKFLKFNGKTLIFKSIDNQYWIAIKPICDALGLEYTRIFKNIKNHKVFSQLLAIQPMVGADNRLRDMVALPEKWVYGWLCNIQSDNQLLLEYQKECYDILFNHFHGAITGRIRLLEDKSELLIDLEKAKTALAGNPDFIKIEEIRASLRQTNKALRKADNNKIEQLQLQFNN